MTNATPEESGECSSSPRMRFFSRSYSSGSGRHLRHTASSASLSDVLFSSVLDQPQDRHRSDAGSGESSIRSLLGVYKDESSASPPATWSMNDGMGESNVDLVVPRMTIPQSPVMHVQEIGHFSIMVCGDSGIGKTTLIQQLSRMPEIITLDVSTDTEMYLGQSENESGDESLDLTGALGCDIHHVVASTGRLPQYQSQQKSNTQTQSEVFTRNLHFYDTPGYGAFIDASTVISSVRGYIERQFKQTNRMLNPTYPSRPELVHLVHNANGAHRHIDCCLYLILDRVKRVDLEYMLALHDLTNVIPIVVKADLLSEEQEKELKLEILRELEQHDVRFFGAGYSAAELRELISQGNRDYPPLAVAVGENVSPVQSPLGFLKDSLLYRHKNMLRHITADKFVAWRANQPSNTEADDMSHAPSSTSTLTHAESVDRFHSLRHHQLKSMNLHIARYVSQQRKIMEQTMLEREKALRHELAIVEKRKRMELIMSELRQLVEEGIWDGNGRRLSVNGLSSSIPSDTASSRSLKETAVVDPKVVKTIDFINAYGRIIALSWAGMLMLVTLAVSQLLYRGC